MEPELPGKQKRNSRKERQTEVKTRSRAEAPSKVKDFACASVPPIPSCQVAGFASGVIMTGSVNSFRNYSLTGTKN